MAIKYIHETMTFKNTSDAEVNLYALGLDNVGPGEECEIPIDLCAPGRGASGNRIPSSIETVAPQLVPADPEAAKVWKKPPAAPQPKSLIVATTSRPASEPVGVAHVRAAKAAAEAPKAPEKKPG